MKAGDAAGSHQNSETTKLKTTFAKVFDGRKQPMRGLCMQINQNGELIDPWGTPCFFHQLSGADMEIHSAGPDRVMWTTDDLVIK